MSKDTERHFDADRAVREFERLFWDVDPDEFGSGGEEELISTIVYDNKARKITVIPAEDKSKV